MLVRALPLTLATGVAATFVLLATESPGDRFGPQVAALTAGMWFVATAGRVLWGRARGNDAPFSALTFHGFYFFLLLSSAVYALFSLDAAEPELTLSPDQPDNLPGLITDLRFYYLAVHAAVVLLISLYGQSRGRLLETAVAMQVVYASPLFEPVWRTDIGAPLLLGNMLVIAAFALAEGRDNGLSEFRWTPFGLPLVALVGAGLLATITAAYVQHSLTIAAKIGSMALLALLIMNLIRRQRQLWLLWAALVLPGVAMAVTILYKLVEIGNHMGIEFAVRHRFHFLGLTAANTIGLLIAVDLLLIIGALFWVRRTAYRAGLILLVIPLVPALLSLRSTSALLALAVGLVTILGAAWSRQFLTEARRLLNPATAVASIVIVGAITAVLVIPNPYLSEWQDEISDPTTGRGVRTLVWNWSLDDFRHHPVLGIGLADRRFEPRTEHLPEFPFRDVTSLTERRFLLGGKAIHWQPIVWGHPHNVLLAVGETMGSVGLLALFWLFALLLMSGIDLVRKPMTRERWVMTVAMACVGAGLAWNLFALGQNVAIMPLNTWVLLGLLGAGYCMVHPTEDGRLPVLSLSAGLSRVWVWLRERLRSAWVPLASLALVVAFLGMVARPAVAEIIAGRAHDEWEQDQFSEAISGFKLARRLDPLNADYLWKLGQLYLRTEDPASAVAALERLVEIQPKNALSRTRLGWAYWLDGRLDAAVQEFERATELDPWNALGAGNFTALGLAHMASGNRAEAIAALKQAFFVDPEASRDRAWLPLEGAAGPDRVLDPVYFPSDRVGGRLKLLLHRRLGLPTPAITIPSLPPAPIRTLYLSEVLESAYADYQAERTLAPKRAQGMLSALARAYAAAEIPGRAAELLTELQELAPNESYVQYDLGMAYVELGRDSDGEQAFRAALSLAEQSSSYDVYRSFAHYQLGLIYLRNADHERALKEFRATLDTYRWPYFPEAYRALAEAATRSGNEEEAKATLRKLAFLLGTDTVPPTETLP